MKHAHAMCLAFNSIGYVSKAMELFEEQHKEAEIASRTLVDCHYPLAPFPDHSLDLVKLAALHGWNYVRPKENRGCHGNWSWVVKELGLGDGDVLVGVDPDARPQQAGWVTAMMKVFDAAPEAYTVQLNRKGIYDLKSSHPFNEIQIGETEVLDYKCLISWSVGGFDCGWVNRLGGMKADSVFYGYIEHAMQRNADPYGGKFYILRDFYDEHLPAADQLYQDWKLESACRRTEKSLADWLKEKNAL